MNININKENRTVQIEMKDQTNKLIYKSEEASGDNIKIKVSTPATHNLFKVNITSEELEGKRSDILKIFSHGLMGVEIKCDN